MKTLKRLFKEEQDKLSGGKADNIKKLGNFDLDEIKKGLNVEMEHTNDPAVALEIVLDHLTEDSHYYQKLAKVHNFS